MMNKMTIIDTSKDEQQGERHQLWPKVHEFLEYTTAHGCGRLAASKGIPWKVFWITFFLAAHSMFWYQSALIVTDYLDRPIRTKISIEHAQKQNFPMITICNRNSMRKSKITPDVELKIQKAFGEIKKQAKTSSNTTDAFNGAIPSPGSVHSNRARLDALRKILFDIEYDDLVKMGHALKDMIVDCSFNSQDCR
ncbi:Amiloride-sensitive sodium channel subunit alpha [Exaiptasia diaphana]|nr:Amiloride-sensitive sodium channel subunit alpha [Exaiptasia diaphana]